MKMYEPITRELDEINTDFTSSMRSREFVRNIGHWTSLYFFTSWFALSVK